jgi:hypothetical protein
MMKWQEVLPVIISIIVIVLVAVIQKQSKMIAAITATMPLTIPLTLWIVYSSVGGDQQQVSQFTLGLMLGVIPTIGFACAIWLASRVGLKLIPMLIVGYAVWGIGVIGIYRLKGLFPP